MKSILLSSLVTVWGFSGVASAADLQAYDISNCQFWTPAPAATGYYCANFPYTYRVADAQSFGRAIQSLEKRVRELEKKLKDLESHR